jgi:hypothetical protein
MRRTSTLHAAAAALGLLAGFAMTPAERPLLEGEVTPHTVALAWDAPPSPVGGEGDVAGVQVDDWGGRLKPAERPVKLQPMRARPPQGRSAPAPRAAPSPAPRHKAHRAPHPLVLRQQDLASFQLPGRECPREAEAAARRAADAERHAAHAARREAHAKRHAELSALRAAHAEVHAAYNALTQES